MESGLLVVGGVLLVVCLVAVLALWLRPGRGLAEKVESLNRSQNEIAGRLSQLVESQTASASQTAGVLGELKVHLNVIDQAQKNITELTGQVVSLQDILANKQARGAFGEIQLHDIVVSALPPSAYRFQATLGNDRRADCVIKLPNPPGPIVIDAKFPLESYHSLREAEDEARRAAARRAFAEAIQKHIRDIAERYIVPGETAESALMFLPSEAVYAELHANFPDVVAQSHRARVWIVSPTTLMATLNTVRAVLKDVRMREQAGVIQAEVMALLEDVGRLQKRVGELKRHFGQAEDDIRKIDTSTVKITRKAERIEEVQFEEGDEGDEGGGAAAELDHTTPRLVGE